MDILKMIFNAKLEKNKGSLDISKKKLMRRGLKLSEESGEVAEAIFGITDDENYKQKTYEDLREELVDTIIVAMDMLMSVYDDEDLEEDFDTIVDARSKVFEEKIKKWLKDKK